MVLLGALLMGCKSSPVSNGSGDVFEVKNNKENYYINEDYTPDLLVKKNGVKISDNQYFVDYSNYNSQKIGTYDIKVSFKNNDYVHTFSVNVVKRESLNFLMIGNSFSEDTITYIKDIANSLNVEANIYIRYTLVDAH